MKLAKFLLSALALGLAVQSPVLAQCVSITTAGSAVSQNFDTLANTGTTNNLTITGWFLTESGGGTLDNEQYAADTGASNSGDTYSYGAAAAADRALGGLQSGSLIPIFGACFTNNTGVTLTSLRVDYTGEQWRLGATSRTDRIDFQYSTTATSLVTGSWTDVNELDFTTPFTTTVGARDGNAAANRIALTHTIPALSIANGATVWIRWTDFNASGADDGLAVDDFSLTGDAGPCGAISFPYTLPNNLSTTLVNAITCANNNGVSADTIDLNGQVITLTAAHADYTGATGLPQIVTPVTLQNGTVTRSGGAPQFRLLNVGATGNLTLDGVTVSGGSLASSDNAGAIFNDGGTLNVINSTVTNNSAGFGGALYNNGAASTITIIDSTLSSNSATQNGGFMMNDSGSATIIRSTVSGNSSTGPSGNGAIYNFEADLDIIDSAFTGNTSTTSVGALQNFAGTTNIANSVFAGNSSVNTSGAVLNNAAGVMTITNSAFIGNRAGNVGGALTNNTLSTVSITNSTFAGNNGSNGGGGIAILGAGTTSITNSIVWGNNGNTLTGATITYSIIEGGFAGTGNLNVDPLFVSPQAFTSAPTSAGNYRLQDSSPAVDAGSNAAVPVDTFDVNGNASTTDEAPDVDGNPRRYDDTGITDTGLGTAPMVDLGAYEKQTNSPLLFPMDVDFCNLQFPTSFTVAAGSTSPVIYGRIYEDDNGVFTGTPGAHPSIVAQVGHGPLGSDPRGGNPAWLWFPATYNVQVGNDDEYQATFTVPFAPTSTQRSYTYRFSVDSGANYTYCDTNGNGTNGGLSFSTANLGTLTINPGSQPSISINDVALAEGNSGVTPFSFTVSLSGPSLSAVTFDIATADNTATVANGDYVANSQTGVVIPAGQTSTTFMVLVNRDTTFEPNETFFVNLTNIVGAVAGDAQGIGTIVNDDVDPCAAYIFPYTMAGNTPAELIQAINCANANGASADTINLNGQTVTLTAVHTSVFGSGTGLPEITTAVVIENGTITRNSADLFRFFVHSGGSSLTLNNITLSNGNPQWDGGAIWGLGSTTLIINNSRIIGNSGVFGGAIFVPSTGTAVITNTLLSGNRASSPGGAIRTRGNLTLNNSTIAGNFTTAGTEGGGGIANNSGTVVLNNSIVHGNEASAFPATNDIRGTFTANNSLVGVNPLFVDLLDASDTAPTTGGDYRLAAFGPAIDAGSNSLIPGGVITDLDGNPRRDDDLGVIDTGVGAPPIVDIGAYERQLDSVPPVTLVQPTALTVSEAGETTDTFVVSLNQTPSVNVTIQLTFDTNVVVNPGSGFGVSPQTVTLTPANAVSGVTVTVRAVDDAIDETSPHAALITTSATSSAQAAFNGLAVADVAVAIADNDTAGIVVSETGGTTSVTEGGAGDSYTLLLSSRPVADVTVNMAFDAAQVVVNGDTDGITSVTFTPADWNVGQSVNVAAVDDTLVETNPHATTIVQTISSTDPNYAAINPADIAAQIVENDLASIVLLGPNTSVAETVGNVALTTRLQLVTNGAPGGTLTGALGAQVVVTDGTATAGNDYSLSTIGVTFPAGSVHNATQLVDIGILNDRLLEGAESFVASLGAVTGTGTASGSNTVTIGDDEIGVFSFNLAGDSTGEAAGNYNRFARLTIAGSGVGTTFRIANAASVALVATPGSAGAPADYALATSVLNVPANAGSPLDLGFDVNIVDDQVVEGSEILTIGFGAITGTAALSAAGTHVVTINDNDTVTVGFVDGDVSVSEGVGTTTRTVGLSFTTVPAGGGSLGVGVTVPVSFTEGTATEPEDFTLATSSVTFPVGASAASTQSVQVNIVDDAAVEPSETFSVQLTTAGAPPYVSFGATSTTLTILDDDQQPTTTEITSDNPDPSPVNTPYTVAVTVRGASTSPTGTVTVDDGTGASCGPVALVAGTAPASTASCAITSTTPGTKTLTATYTPSSAAFGASTDTEPHTVIVVAPALAYAPTPGTTVTYTGVTTTGTTGTATIAITPSGGAGTGAAATTSVGNCVFGGANAASFALGTVTLPLAFEGATTTVRNLPLTCTASDVARIATLSCDETRGTAAATPRSWPLSCPAGTPLADMGITGSVSPSPVNAGTNVTYVLTATNAGPSVAQAVQVSLPLPTGTGYVSVTQTGATCTTPAAGAAGTVTCTWAGATTVGQARALTVVASVPASSANGTVLAATATTTSSTPDPATPNNSLPLSTTVATASTLAPTLTATPSPVVAGTNVTWTASATKAGPSDAQGVQLSLPLPATTRYVSATASTGGTCTTPAVGATGTVTCTWAGATAPTLVRSVDVVAQVQASATGTLAATVSASSTTNPTPATASTSTPITSTANLQLGLTASPTSVNANGGVITYVATATNNGPSDASALTITIPFPIELGVTSAVASAGGTCSGTSTVTCTWPGATAPGESRTATITAAVQVSASRTLFVTATANSGATVTAATATTGVNIAAPIPVDDPRALLLMFAAMLLLGGTATRRMRAGTAR